MTVEMRAFVDGEIFRFDIAVDARVRSEYHSLGIDDIAAQFAHDQKARCTHFALDRPLFGNDHQFRG